MILNHFSSMIPIFILGISLSGCLLDPNSNSSGGQPANSFTISSIGNLQVYSNKLSTIQVYSTADSPTYSLSVSPTNFGISVGSSGLITVNSSSIADAGSYTVTVSVKDSNGTSQLTKFNLTILPVVALSKSKFSEGDVGYGIVGITIHRDKPILKVSSSNFSSFFTPILVNGIYSFVNGDVPVNSNSGLVNLSVDGSVRFAKNDSLSLVIHFVDGTSETYSLPVEIDSLNLGYVDYNLHNVLNSGTPGLGYSSVFQNIIEIKRLYSGWKIPILTAYSEEEFMCSGTILGSVSARFNANSTTHVGCLKQSSATNSQSVFLFGNLTSDGTSYISGFANGIEGGIALGSTSAPHTLAHELGHNLGLWHTFESSFNQSEIYQAVSYQVAYNSQLGQQTSDWPNYIYSFNGSGGSEFVNFNGIADDTDFDPFNSKTVSISGFVSLIYIGNQAIGGAADSTFPFSCYQTTYSSSTWQTSCDPASGVVLSNQSINNVMSYWLKQNGSAVLTPGQKQRMDRVLSLHPETTHAFN